MQRSLHPLWLSNLGALILCGLPHACDLLIFDDLRLQRKNKQTIYKIKK